MQAYAVLRRVYFIIGYSLFVIRHSIQSLFLKNEYPIPNTEYRSSGSRVGLSAEGLEEGLFGLGEGGAVGVVLAQLGVNGLGLLDVFHAARGDDLTGKNFRDVIIVQLQVFEPLG
jgi:hypothetical protein